MLVCTNNDIIIIIIIIIIVIVIVVVVILSGFSDTEMDLIIKVLGLLALHLHPVRGI